VGLKSFSGQFVKRAVKTCHDLLSKGIVRSSSINDVLRYENIDVTPFEDYLSSDNDDVRLSAVKIIGTRGDVSKLIPMALKEEDSMVFSEIMKHVSKRPDLVEDLSGLVVSDNTVLREQAIAMFRAAGRADCLLPLAFDSDDRIVSRVKKYMEQEDNAKTSS